MLNRIYFKGTMDCLGECFGQGSFYPACLTQSGRDIHYSSFIIPRSFEIRCPMFDIRFCAVGSAVATTLNTLLYLICFQSWHCLELNYDYSFKNGSNSLSISCSVWSYIPGAWLSRGPAMLSEVMLLCFSQR